MKQNIFLPAFLWNSFMNSVRYYLAYTYSCSVTSDAQIWTMIPNKDRNWITLNDLEHSFFTKKSELIGLDFNIDTPIISTGQYWIEQIKEAINNEFSKLNRNIYIYIYIR